MRSCKQSNLLLLLLQFDYLLSKLRFDSFGSWYSIFMFVGENKWNVRSETICEFVLFLWFYILYFGILFYNWVYECSSTILTVLTWAIPLDHAHISPWPHRLKADITSLSFTPFLSRLQLGDGDEFLLLKWRTDHDEN